jgi:hypothetical protein
MPTARDTPIRDSACPHHQLNQPRQFHNDFSIDAEPPACALAGELQARIQSRNLIGRILTLPPERRTPIRQGSQGIACSCRFGDRRSAYRDTALGQCADAPNLILLL